MKNNKTTNTKGDTAIQAEKLARTILLNRILQTDKSPAKKTQAQIAKKCSVSPQKVDRMERYLRANLSEKINILIILAKTK